MHTDNHKNFKSYKETNLVTDPSQTTELEPTSIES